MFTTIGMALLRLWKKDGAWTPQFAKRAGLIVVVAIVILVVLPVTKCVYDRSVITKHEAKIAEDVLEADRAANEALAQEQAEFAAGQDRLDRAATEAAKANPAGAAKPVGPVTRSYYDNLPEKK